MNLIEDVVAYSCFQSALEDLKVVCLTSDETDDLWSNVLANNNVKTKTDVELLTRSFVLCSATDVTPSTRCSCICVMNRQAQGASVPQARAHQSASLKAQKNRGAAVPHYQEEHTRRTTPRSPRLHVLSWLRTKQAVL